MSNVSNVVNGGDSSPLRSVSFLIASIVGLVSVVIDVYLIYRHWHTAPLYVAFILSTPIGAQLIYLWFRVLRDWAKLRELRSKSSVEETKDSSLLVFAEHVSVRGMIDQLFYSYGIAIFALILIGLLLSRLDGLR
jgi:ABC-type amino acid transport system permease subunit